MMMMMMMMVVVIVMESGRSGQRKHLGSMRRCGGGSQSRCMGDLVARSLR